MIVPALISSLLKAMQQGVMAIMELLHPLPALPVLLGTDLVAGRFHRIHICDLLPRHKLPKIWACTQTHHTAVSVHTAQQRNQLMSLQKGFITNHCMQGRLPCAMRLRRALSASSTLLCWAAGSATTASAAAAVPDQHEV